MVEKRIADYCAVRQIIIFSKYCSLEYFEISFLPFGHTLCYMEICS